MESKIWKCNVHGRPLELYCNSCKTYICAECLSTHSASCPAADYDHVFGRAQKIALPKLQQLLAQNEQVGPQFEDESVSLLTNLCNIITPLKTTVTEHAESAEKLNELVLNVEKFAQANQKANFQERKKKQLEALKKQLQEALTEQNLAAVSQLTHRALAEGEVQKGSKEEAKIATALKTDIKGLNYLDTYKSMAEDLQRILAQCDRLRLNKSVFNWKCDRRYVSSKLSVAENGLEIRCSESGGYAAVVGDTPIDYGVLVYEVTASGLCCNGKEGFGVIEVGKFRELYSVNSKTQNAHDYMIGLMCGDMPKSMLVLTGKELLLDVPYVVSINMCDHVMNIKGPGTLLTTELESGVAYVPCFSLGCTNNVMKIKPLEAMEEE